jgi:hypothetical protein
MHSKSPQRAILAVVSLAIGAAGAAMCLFGCVSDDAPRPQASTNPCVRMASAATNPYATPGTVELALEYVRVKCLGMTADGSRQLVAGGPQRNAAAGNPNLSSPNGMTSIPDPDARYSPMSDQGDGSKPIPGQAGQHEE